MRAFSPHWVPGIVSIGGLIVAVFSPPRFHDVMQEDAAAEWTTFFAFALAGVYGLLALSRYSDRLAKAFVLGLAAFCFFVAGEEISWGHRLFAFAPPEIFLKHNFQQEPNAHNLLKELLDTRWMVLIIALGYGILVPGLPRAWLGRFRWLSPPRSVTPWCAAVVLIEAQYPFPLSGEWAECLLGLAFVTDLHHRARDGQKSPLRAHLGACLAGWMAAPLCSWMLYGQAEAAVAQTRSELKLLAQDLLRPATRLPRLRKKARVHKRVFTAVSARYLRLGTTSAYLEHQSTPAESETNPRRDRRGYFLDAWQQPLWIFSARAPETPEPRIYLYSFGPNRRRDTRFTGTAPLKVQGDDIVEAVRSGVGAEPPAAR